jgi:hypothetical protein
LPQFGKEQLVATLVVFRILYFLIPFGISISIMGTRELWLNVGAALAGTPPAQRSLHGGGAGAAAGEQPATLRQES